MTSGKRSFEAAFAMAAVLLSLSAFAALAAGAGAAAAAAAADGSTAAFYPLEPLPLVPHWQSLLDPQVVARAEALAMHGCFEEGGAWTYHECCLGLAQDHCWLGEEWFACCTGQAEMWQTSAEMKSSKTEAGILAAPSLPDEVLQCILEGELENDNVGIWEPAPDDLFQAAWLRFQSTKAAEGLCRNSLTTVVKCLAALPSTSVVLDVLWGFGCTATAAYEGLASQPDRPPAEIFGFERWAENVYASVNQSSRLGQPLYVLPARYPHALRTLRKLLSASQPLDLGSPGESPTSVPRILPVLLHGTTFGGQSLKNYADGGLDILCRHRPSVDILIIDPPLQFAMVTEWEILMTFCKPTWVILNNRNLGEHAGGWIFSHLHQQPDKWRLELMGELTVAEGPWPPIFELKRMRSWAVFRRQLP